MQMMDSSAADELLETRSRVVGFRLRVQRICGKTGQETGWQGYAGIVPPTLASAIATGFYDV